MGVQVAREDLRGDWRCFEAQTGADFLFRVRADVSESADGSGNFANADFFGRGVEASLMTAKLVPPESGFEAEGDGLGVHAVGTADLDGVAMLEGQLVEGR